MVAAAILLKRSRLRVRIDDSKRLTPRQRLLAYEAIYRWAEVGVGIVPASVIDTRNIRRAALLAMATAVAELPTRPELALVDGNQSPELGLPCWTIVNGDHLSYPIACASIIAKVTRDSLMRFYHRIFPDYAFDQHKGYGTPLHIERLRIHGPCALHRLSFEPISCLTTRPLGSLPTAQRDVPQPDAQLAQTTPTVG